MTKEKEQNEYAIELIKNEIDSVSRSSSEEDKKYINQLQKAIEKLQSQSKDEVIELAYKKCIIRGKYSGTGNYRTCERCAEEKWIIGCADYENTKSKGEVIASGVVEISGHDIRLIENNEILYLDDVEFWERYEGQPIKILQIDK